MRTTSKFSLMYSLSTYGVAWSNRTPVYPDDTKFAIQSYTAVLWLATVRRNDQTTRLLDPSLMHIVSNSSFLPEGFAFHPIAPHYHHVLQQVLFDTWIVPILHLHLNIVPLDKGQSSRAFTQNPLGFIMKYSLLICGSLLFSAAFALNVNFDDKGTFIELVVAVYQIAHPSSRVHQERNQIHRHKSNIILQQFHSYGRSFRLVFFYITTKFWYGMGLFHRLLVLNWRYAIQRRSGASFAFSTRPE